MPLTHKRHPDKKQARWEAWQIKKRKKFGDDAPGEPAEAPWHKDRGDSWKDRGQDRTPGEHVAEAPWRKDRGDFPGEHVAEAPWHKNRGESWKDRGQDRKRVWADEDREAWSTAEEPRRRRPREDVNETPSSKKIPAAPGPFMCSVSLVTFGLERLDEELAKHVFQQGGGARASIDDDDLRLALRRSVGFRADVVVDARHFPDPDSHSLRRHTGHHPEIISRIVRHRNFREWLTAVKAEFVVAAEAREANARADGSIYADVGVAVYCRSGKHRSVAGALVLKCALEAEKWLCPEARHLSQKTWYRCCRGLCPECTERPESLQETLLRAREVWLRLPGDARRHT